MITDREMGSYRDSKWKEFVCRGWSTFQQQYLNNISGIWVGSEQIIGSKEHVGVNRLIIAIRMTSPCTVVWCILNEDGVDDIKNCSA